MTAPRASDLHAERPADSGPGARRRSGACGARPLGAGDGARVLAVDVGTGTADILLTLPGEPLENAVRLVVPSRTQVVAREIAAATAAGASVVFAGTVMGGGACGAAMKRHVAAGLPFVAGETAARTFADDLDRVRERGVEVVSDAEAAALAAKVAGRDCGMERGGDASRRGARRTGVEGRDGSVAVRSGDLDVDGLRHVLRRLGVAPSFDVVCIAAQDHGFSPRSSNRAFRFGLWDQAVSGRRRLQDLFYELPDIPAAFTRLRAAAGLAAELGGDAPVLAADTGPAALLGALPEESGDCVLVNVGNGHVVCAVARGGRLAGVFEHHTTALDGTALEDRLRRFLAGELASDEVRDDGGHGAVLAPGALAGLELGAVLDGRWTGRERPARDGSLPGLITVTGPRRDLLRGADLPLEFAAPHGDMMLTGCYGLLRAARECGLVPAPG